MAAPDPQALAAAMPFAVAVGAEVTAASAEEVRGRLAWAPERCTSGGTLHGGAIMALADTCGAVCAYLNLPAGAQATATIESKTNFLRAVQGGAVIATTKPLHKGRTLIVLDTEVAREDGKLAARVTQTQVYHYAR